LVEKTGLEKTELSETHEDQADQLSGAQLHSHLPQATPAFAVGYGTVLVQKPATNRTVPTLLSPDIQSIT